MKIQIRGLMLVVLLSSGTGSFAFLPSGRDSLSNFDRRLDARWTNQVAPVDRSVAVARLRANLPGAQMEFDRVSGAPKFISAGNQFLTGSNGEGKAVSPAVAAGFAVTD